MISSKAVRFRTDHEVSISYVTHESMENGSHNLSSPVPYLYSLQEPVFQGIEPAVEDMCYILIVQNFTYNKDVSNIK